MLLLLLNYVVLRALWDIDVYLISTLVKKSLCYYLFSNYLIWKNLDAENRIHYFALINLITLTKSFVNSVKEHNLVQVPWIVHVVVFGKTSI